MKIKITVLLLSLLVVVGCRYENEEQLYNCFVDAANAKYSTTVTSIINAYGCKGCHAGVAPSGGHNFETYEGLKEVADNGMLYGAVTHAPGFEPMPQGGAKMSDCDIKKLKAWIDAGAPNN